MFHLFARLTEFLYRARGGRVQLDLTRYGRILAQIGGQDLTAENDSRLKERSANLAARARRGSPLDKLLVEAFALVRESARRVLAMRPFDVQVLAAIAMHQGKLAEMQTGEGKTLAAVLPAYLNALTGQGVHVLTFNDYLARRDAQWMGPLYRFLGLTVGAVQQGMSPADRRRAYACDVTYVTAKEAGFDYLRDHLCMAPEDLVHRPFHYAIVDEADSILIDEARVPLVIAGSVEARRVDPYQAAALVRSLDARRDFETDEFARNAHFTDSGLDRLEAQLRCGDLHAAENLDLLTELSMALHAQLLLRREVDYIVRDGQIELVDEFTGRVAENRRWPDGLQAAVEAKEGVPLRPQGTIRGSITLQHFLRLYPKVSGMTATAQAAAAEFEEFYELAVVVIPPNRPCVRVDAEDTVFTHKEAKYAALVEEIAAARRRGQPVLVGTASVAESEHLAARLAKAGVGCRVLNARNDEQEAAIVAQAAMPGAVTISTNMAGRGTDIKLGGDPPDEREPVVARGGLYVIGTNRHESRRIDDQLRGRAGRQGDPGQSRFFISLEDDLMERYGIGDLLPQRYRELRQDEPLADPAVARAIARSQRFIETQTFEIRRTLWKYASFVEEQRKLIHRRRQAILLDKISPNLLADRSADRYEQLRGTVGEQVLRQVEKQITLFHIDKGWAEYLVRVADIRENIHLVVLGANLDPLDEFHKMVGREFGDLLRRIEERIVETFCSVEVTKMGIDLEKEGLTGPASTWTYLINDNPCGDVLQRLLRGLKRSLVRDARTSNVGSL
jgi:preprotein translocase subunit SecA